MGHARALLRPRAGAAAGRGGTARPRRRACRCAGDRSAGAQTLDRQSPASGSASRHGADPNITRLEQDLTDKLGAKVHLQHGAKGRGKLVINYQQPRRARRHPRAHPVARPFTSTCATLQARDSAVLQARIYCQSAGFSTANGMIGKIRNTIRVATAGAGAAPARHQPEPVSRRGPRWPAHAAGTALKQRQKRPGIICGLPEVCALQQHLPG